MTKLTFDKHVVGPWVFTKIGKVWGPEGREAIGLERDGEVVAGVVLEDFTGVAASLHVAIDNPHIPVRKLLVATAGYCFNQLKLDKVIGVVPSSNAAALKFDYGIGFRPEAIIKGVYPGADMVIMSMTREQCSFIPKKVA